MHAKARGSQSENPPRSGVWAKSIAVFFAIAQAFGAFGSHWYGHLIGNGTDRTSLFVGYPTSAWPSTMITRRRGETTGRRDAAGLTRPGSPDAVPPAPAEG